MQKANEVALTKLDCLSGLPTIKICIAYELNGKRLSHYPLTDELFDVKPVYETLPGWREDITNIRRFEDLPMAAQEYVLTIERFVGCPIRYVSVGPEREQLIVRCEP